MKELKDTIFISHATPDDNIFAAWLATKLELCGYKVWVDLNNLNPSVDFWETIDKTIRENTIKFIFVASKTSCDSQRDGIKKELAVADRMKRETPNFILPVRIDDVSFNALPIEILRLNAIDFSLDWAKGLDEVLKHLSEENIAKPNNTNQSQFYVDRWSQSQSNIRSQLTDDINEYCSNLFPVELPQKLYLYRSGEVDSVLKERHIPNKKNKKVSITFACNKCVSLWLNREVEYLELDISECIKNDVTPKEYMGEIFSNLSRDIISLINWSIGEYFYSNGLRRYKPDNKKTSKNVYYFKFGDKYKRTGAKRSKALSGKYKTIKHWHFGLSGYYVSYPCEGIVIKWHLVFSDANFKMLSDGSQIAARRSKGRLMFNKEWRELLQTAMEFCSQGAEYGCYTSCCEENCMYIGSKSQTYIAQKSYIEPYVYKSMGDDNEE